MTEPTTQAHETAPEGQAMFSIAFDVAKDGADASVAVVHDGARVIAMGQPEDIAALYAAYRYGICG